MTTPDETVTEIVAGDITKISTLESWPDEEFALVDADREFVLTAAAAARALESLRSHHVSETAANAWAWFIRCGVPLGRNLTVSVSIEYDPANEDAVAVAVMRLSELGDLVDGSISPGEMADLLAALGSTKPQP